MSGVLGLKIGRRLLAAVALDDERIVFHDSRYVSSRTHGLDAGVGRYFARLLEQLKPACIAYYAPTSTQTTTEHLVSLLEQLASRVGLPIHRLTKSDLASGVGVRQARTRRELREQLLDLWPALAECPPARQLVLVEAAVSAFVGDLRQTLAA